MGALGGVTAVLLLAWPAADAWFNLADARGERAAVEAALARPAPVPALLIRAGGALRAGDAASARAALAQSVRHAAAAQALLVEELTPAQAPGPRTAAIDVSLSGGSKAVLSVLDDLEGNAPAARFQTVAVTALAEDGLRLKGRLVVVWQP